MNREVPPVFNFERKKLPIKWNEDCYTDPEKGSISQDGKLTWIYRGSALLVNSFTAKGDPYLLSEADFSRLLEEPTVTISYVCQLRDHLSDTDPEWNPFALVVVANRRTEVSQSSFVCIYDSRLSRILTAIECPFSVRLAQPIVVSNGGRAPQLLERLPPELRVYHGLIALGCDYGTVTLVDLCLDSECDSALPTRKLTYASRSKNYDPHAKRLSANINMQNISLSLNSECQNKFQFTYKADDSKKIPIQLNTTYVTCLKYIPRLNIICVAYNFHGYHLYDLEQLNLLYSGSIDDSDCSVVGFDFQEPEEDPKNLCYLWILRGSTVKECGEYGLSSVQLTSLLFSTKRWINGYGYLYSGFESSTLIFDYDLTGFPYQADRDNCSSSMVINYGTLLLGSPWYLRATNEDYTPDTTLFYFSWEATNETSDEPIQYFAVFDINQFYRAQMPRNIELSGDLQLCQFLGFFSMAEISTDVPNETILDFSIDASTIQRFQSNNFVHDLHFHPSSLSFVTKALTDQSVVVSHYYGLQRLNLHHITSKGPNVLTDPKRLLKNAVTVGLCMTKDIHNENLASQREFLLALLLERNEIALILNIATAIGTGDLIIQNFNMKTIIEWIWSRISITKAAIDEVSAPLFDESVGGAPDDKWIMKTLVAYESDLKNLSCLLSHCLFLLDGADTKFNLDCLQFARDRQAKLERIIIYLRVMLWLRWVGLLPESANVSNDPAAIAYPKKELVTSYKARRKRFSGPKSGSKATDFLLIDRIVWSVRESIGDHWKKSGGHSTFPPPSIQALLSIYLLDGVSMEVKNLISSYFFLDLVSLLPESEATNNMKTFANTLRLSPTFTKFISGLWCIDNGNNVYGLPNLLDPCVVKEFFSPASLDTKEDRALFLELSSKIVNLLVLQNEEIFAQRFLLGCKAASHPNTITEAEHRKLNISTLLTNGQILPAFEVLRSEIQVEREAGNSSSSVEALLNHFFTACESHNLMKALVKLPFDSYEERKFEAYLMKHSKLPQAKLILVVFLLQANKFTQALSLYEVIRNQKDVTHAPHVVELASRVESIVEAYKNALPSTVISQGALTNAADDDTFSDIASSEFDDAESVTSSMSVDITTPRKPRRTRKTASTDNTDSAARTHRMQLRSSATKKR